MFITYLNQERTDTTQTAQMSFDEFYANLTNPQPVETPLPTAYKPKFKTIIAPTLTFENIDILTSKINNFQTRFETRITRYKDHNMQDHYTSFNIPKRSGGTRTINAPNTDLKQLLAEINAALQSYGILPHNCAYAYVQSRCIKDALIVHQKRGHSWFLKIDLHDFFGSCNSTFITNQLNKIPFFHCLPYELFDNLLHLCMLNDGLPQGSPLSPWLTNQIMLPIDYELQRKCTEHNITYTRYADDLLFSSTSKTAVQHAERLINELLRNTPLRINHEKTKISSIYGQNWNLGLMLNKDHNITVGNKRKEIFRATLNNFCETPAAYDWQSASEFLGKIQYYISIEPEYFQGVLTKYGQKYNMDIKAKLIDIIKNQH